MYFTIHIPVSNTQLPFKLHTLVYTTNNLLLSFFLTLTSNIPIPSTDTEKYLPSDNPNIKHLIVSQYDCEKQQYLRQFNLLNVKQYTEAPSNIQHANVNARVYVRAKVERIKAYKCVSFAKKKEKSVSKFPVNTDVLIELYEIITPWNSLLHLVPLSLKNKYQTS